MSDLTATITSMLRTTVVLGVWWNGFLVPVWDTLKNTYTYMDDLREKKEKQAGLIRIQTTEDVAVIRQKVAGIKRRYSELDRETLKLKEKYTSLQEETYESRKYKDAMLRESMVRFKKLKTYSLEDNEDGLDATIKEIAVAKGIKNSIKNFKESQRCLEAIVELVENAKSSSPSDTCNICYNSYDDNKKRIVIAECGHMLCSDCIKHTNNKCPTCRTKIEKKSIVLHV